MKKGLISLAKKAGYVLAALILIAALGITVSWLLTPLFDKHRSDIEKWASVQLQTPVTIGNVRMAWYHYQPEINLNEVIILNKDTHKPILQIQRIRVFFSIFQSLWQWKLVLSGIIVAGTEVNLHETSEGEIAVQGFPSNGFNAQPFQNETKFTDVLVWLSTQPRLILQGVDIRYTGLNGLKRFITLYNLSFKNSDAQHTVLGSAILHQDIPTEANVAIQWEGYLTDPQNIKAKIYLYVSGFSLTQWLQGYVWKGWEIKQGIATAKIWAIWKHNTFQKVQSIVQAYGLNLYSQTDKSLHKINRLSSHLGWRREAAGQIFAGDDILIDLPNHLWPVTSFYVALASPPIPTISHLPSSAAKKPAEIKIIPKAGPNSIMNSVLSMVLNATNATSIPTQPLSLKAVNLGYIDLADVQPFLFSSSSFLPDDIQKMISALKLEGGLQNAAIIFSGPWNDWSHLSLNAYFNDVGFASWHQYPGINHLSGTVKWNGTQGHLLLNSSQSTFYGDAIFANPIVIDQLSGDIAWQRDQQGKWLLRASSLQLFNNDAAANINGTLTISQNTVPIIDMNANFTMQKANHITRYLPLHIFDKSLVNWLQNAFETGEVKSGHAVLRGPLNDFPFDKGNGTFTISGIVNNVDLHYAPLWPVMRHINGRLDFMGRRMIIDVDHAQIFGILLPHVHGVIPYLGDKKSQRLQVQSENIQTDFTQALHFIHHSPLEKSIGKMFKDIEMRGPITLKLGLTVPLKDPEKTRVQGVADIQNAEMNLAPWHLLLSKLKGQIQFTESSTKARHIQGELFNKRLQFSLQTIQKGKIASIVQATFEQTLNIKDVENWLKLPIAKMLQGSTKVTGEIDFSLQAPMEIHLQSDLVGVAVNLPGQYRKRASQSKPVEADIIVQEKQPLRLKVNYGDLISAALILDHENEKYNLLSANLQLGKGSVNWPETPGLYITGNFDQLDWDKIKFYIDQVSSNQSGTTNFSALSLRRININAKILNLGQNLNQVHLQVTPTKAGWNVNVASVEIVGQLNVPANLTAKGSINAQFQKLNLHSVSNQKQALAITVKSLPTIVFSADNVSYNNMPLGQVTFKTIPSTNGLIIQALKISSPRLNFQAAGNWTQSNNRYTTHLQGRALSPNVSRLLNSFNFDVSNFVSSDGRFDFNLTWSDAPYAPALAKMNGTASLKLGSGRIVDIGEESDAKMGLGRMLSLFSLQTIPRRLTLDFSDIFQKGYSFDSVRGDFNLRYGDAYTTNLRFDGPVARVNIDGRIGLSHKDYDLTLEVTPYVASGLPVAAAAWLGGPVAGVAALAGVIGSQMTKISTYQYEVTGPWDNPTWKSASVSKNK